MLKKYSDEIGGDSKYVIILRGYCNNEICHHFKDMFNSENQDFQNDQCVMLQSHAWTKDSTSIQDRPMDLHVRKTNFFNRNLYFTRQLSFKKLLLVKFWCSIKKQCPQLFGKVTNRFTPFSVTYLYDLFFKSFNQNNL